MANLLIILLFILVAYYLFSRFFFHSRFHYPRASLMGKNKPDLQGQLQNASSKPVFLTVHDMGSNRELKQVFLPFRYFSRHQVPTTFLFNSFGGKKIIFCPAN